ncbi:hypothetical protein Poli38472_003196 [Pythium oligandrum]|uniref:Uncharacterized protein n=1 Tax=Pythium oligandrum TaxID=41045 RepID=A0A8K1FCJ7_PYTOL|nr:hypothetical protein Poli38472_003196 [Pythium oligandrum]|eukprot:TMW57271.1 hypothetical protein Poli38472_003196 [Pythium oligandrum]
MATTTTSSTISIEARVEQAQLQALDSIWQQCMDDLGMTDKSDTMRLASTAETEALLVPTAEETASLMDFLADSCAEASDKLEDFSYEDVAKQLAQAVAATQQSLRNVKSNVQQVLDDPMKMQALCDKFETANQHMRMIEHEIQQEMAAQDPEVKLLLEQEEETKMSTALTKREEELPLALASNEETLRTVMQFTESVCTSLDDALSTITKDEYDLAAQLSLTLAQKLLQTGQSIFSSLGDQHRQEAGLPTGDRSERITIEELSDDDTPIPTASAKRTKLARYQKKQTAVLRTYVEGLIEKTTQSASDRPYVAAALGTAALPFIGLMVPMASVVGLALVLEKFFPERAFMIAELCSNAAQMMKLWFLLLKITSRQLGMVAKKCLISWHDHASHYGYVATGMEIASTGWSLGCLGASWFWQSAMRYINLGPSV